MHDKCGIFSNMQKHLINTHKNSKLFKISKKNHFILLLSRFKGNVNTEK